MNDKDKIQNLTEALCLALGALQAMKNTASSPSGVELIISAGFDALEMVRDESLKS